MQKHDFKIGDIVEYVGCGSEALVAGRSNTKLTLLFTDGSYNNNYEPEKTTKLINKKWTSEYIESVLNRGLKNRLATGFPDYVDNLTYIEILAQVREYAK
jgi:hypothetical protein